MFSVYESDSHHKILNMHTVFHKSVMEMRGNTYKSVIFLTLLLIIM